MIREQCRLEYIGGSLAYVIVLWPKGAKREDALVLEHCGVRFARLPRRATVGGWSVWAEIP